MIDDQVQNEIYSFIKELFPLCRSITGEGTSKTLQKIQKKIPIEIKEIPSGTKVFDWEVPKEWNIRDAYIKSSDGKKIVDFQQSNLHVINYSSPVQKELSLNQLKPHLHSIPDYPEWIPYKTTYYKEDWGFCLSHNLLQSLRDDNYKVVIDSEIQDGYLNYGELYIPGKTKEEILISTHICHPSMCNDNLSGISVNTFLARNVLKKENYYSYRFLFIPATIGAIAWLALNEDKLKFIKYGVVTALLGDQGEFNYKKSKAENSSINRIFEFLLSDKKYYGNIREFEPYGYDERQFCSPGINLPVGRLTRTPNKEFPEYHTSADNLDFIKSEKLFESYKLLVESLQLIEDNKYFINQNPKCEPQLGKRGIYNSVAGNIKEIELAMLWVLNYSDGENDLLEISKKSKIKFEIIKKATDILLEHKLIKEAE